MPGDQETISKTWGLVVGKMRQIHVLFFTSEAMKAVSTLENMEEDDFLSQVRAKTMVPIVCGIISGGSAVSVSHAMGSFEVDITEHGSGIVWLAGFLKSAAIFRNRNQWNQERVLLVVN